MFRHQGKSRTLKQNLQIATVLSFVAGIVNVTGYLSFKHLTTNVTGHFALFIYDIANFEFWKGTIYFLYLFSFLLGSFSSGFLIEKYKENKRLNVFFLPTIIESFLLISIGITSNMMTFYYPNLIVCLLLYAMGLQNAFVTKLSNAIVRTTHLTGLFTDLGIDLSHLCFHKFHPKKEKLKSNIKLRIYIICFFFSGGLAGGLFYSRFNWKLDTLFLAAFVLLTSLFYDDLRYRLIKRKRRHDQRKNEVNAF